MLAAAQVVDALAARLAPLAATGGRVKTSRLWPWAESELPACRVYVAAEVVEPTSIGDRIGQHTLAIEAQYSAKATADLDDALNNLAAGALPLLFADPVPYGLQLTGMDRRLATEGEASVGQITLQVQAIVFAAASAPETIL